MATDFTLVVQDRPGALAAIGEALGKAGVNIEAVCGHTIGAEGIIHVAVEDAERAKTALQEAGAVIREERAVVLLDVQDQPGELGRVTRRFADAGINLDLLYLGTRTRMVVSAPDLEAVRRAFGVA